MYLHLDKEGLMSGSFNNDTQLIRPWTHPTWGLSFDGFHCDKYINSQPNAKPNEGSPQVAHGAVCGNIPGISMPGVPMWDYITFPQAMIAAANKGKGWHLMTAVEWAILAEQSRLNGTMPHGGNSNLDPPSDASYLLELGQLDQHLHAENPAYHRPLPGTGPNTWSHNHGQDGIFDLNGYRHWLMGLAGVGTNWINSGYPVTLFKPDLKYLTSAFGRGTISASGGVTPILVCDDLGVNWLKTWTVDEFNTYYIYIAEGAGGAGGWYVINDTYTNALILVNGSNPGNGTATFWIGKQISIDITAGMTSGHRILTLRDADADLKPFAIPLTADVNGSPIYGYDIYTFNKAVEVALVKGGNFGLGTDAGAFATGMYYPPTTNDYTVGFRACKCL